MEFINPMNHYDAMSGELACICATVDGKEISIPISPDNRHYAEIMRQVEAGELVIAEPD